VKDVSDAHGSSVLLVEDDPRIGRALAMTLQDSGHSVRLAPTGAAARAALAERLPDVVLLDLGLPDDDGLVLCREFRAADGELPIIIVTARSDSTDVVAGLEAGADDYVSKPVVGSELSARISSLLRRSRRPEQGTGTLAVGDLSIDLRHGRVSRRDQDLLLTRTERRLMRELATRPGQVVTREELLERVWGYDYFEDTRLLDVHIRRLRTRVETDPSDPRVVMTVRGLGYRLDT
jgi:DNA-binding response OmpR family regulator